MKKILFLSLFSLLAINVFSQTFTIVGKGRSGGIECSGQIVQYDAPVGSNFTIHLTDMLEQEYTVMGKEQIDEKTIRYEVIDANYNSSYIIKQKCPYGKYVYFFEFPPLYSKQGRTIYKAVKKKIVVNGWVLQDGE